MNRLRITDIYHTCSGPGAEEMAYTACFLLQALSRRCFEGDYLHWLL